MEFMACCSHPVSYLGDRAEVFVCAYFLDFHGLWSSEVCRMYSVKKKKKIKIKKFTEIGTKKRNVLRIQVVHYCSTVHIGESFDGVSGGKTRSLLKLRTEKVC